MHLITNDDYIIYNFDVYIQPKISPNIGMLLLPI